MTAQLTTAEEFRPQEPPADFRLSRRQRDMLTTLNKLFDELSPPLLDGDDLRNNSDVPSRPAQ